MNEREKLCKAVDEFAEAMKKRLLQKEKQGFFGWNAGSITSYNIPTRLFRKAAELYALLNYAPKSEKIEDKLLVDIANFAMMLWMKVK
jgi:surfactin synthase thioesterase subunit